MARLRTVGKQFGAMYRIFSAAGDLLYVGHTTSPGKRMHSHSMTQKWWPEVAYAEWEFYPTVGQAIDAEIAAIEDEHPLHNSKHKLYGP